MKRQNRILPLVAAAFTLALVFVPATAHAQRKGQRSEFRSDYLKTNPRLMRAFREVVEPVRKSTVLVLNASEKAALGTVVAPDGFILTKASEIGSKPVVRLDDGREMDAEIVAHHEEFDLAMLKIETSDLTPVEFRPSKEVPVGFWAISVGTERDPIALGVVSVAMRNLPKMRPRQSAYLGVHLQDTDKGAIIENVVPKAGAEKAGLKAKDIILSINGKEITGAESVRNALNPFKTGDTVTLLIQRGDKELEFRAKLGPAPLSRGDLQNQMGSKLSNRIDGFPVVLQHDSIVKPEECGGPLVDLDGKVIGINIARAGRTESYAIPTEVVLPLIRDMKAGKYRVSKENSGQ